MFLRFILTFFIFSLAGCGGGGGNTSMPETPAPPSNNPPVFTSSSTFDVEENQISIGTLVATDSDGDAVSYSVSGDDASAVNIDSSTGALSFVEPPDYESVKSYSITAIASDGTDETTQSLSVAITNIAPPILSEMALSGTYDDGQSEELLFLNQDGKVFSGRTTHNGTVDKLVASF
jgi:hypothetical protein